ncbi:regulator [Streptosporangiaceae bacterium NEAU-GS5]|nr:regulator [Streptosporangiaceae bacterium NEAU-GS5]
MPNKEIAEPGRTMTLEAFADTMLPGARRFVGDRAVAGVLTGGGAVASGAVTVLEMSAPGISAGLDDLVKLLNEHAALYAEQHGLAGDESVPAFVSLPFEHRTQLARQLLAPGHPEKEFWVLLALFSYMAFDGAPHMHTTDALAAGHPGLTAMGFARPDADGLWRFPAYSYGRPLAAIHPDTTPSGSPA